MNDTKFGGCPLCGRQDCVAGSCRPQPDVTPYITQVMFDKTTPEQSSAVVKESLTTERQECISELRSAFIDITLHATKANKIADMLEADAREIEKLQLHIQHIGNDAMRSENARLQAELAALNAHGIQAAHDTVTIELLNDKVVVMQAEIDDLRAALAAKPVLVPMTEDEIMGVVRDKPFNSAIGFARAIEAHHGIGKQEPTGGSAT